MRNGGATYTAGSDATRAGRMGSTSEGIRARLGIQQITGDTEVLQGWLRRGRGPGPMRARGWGNGAKALGVRGGGAPVDIERAGQLAAGKSSNATKRQPRWITLLAPTQDRRNDDEKRAGWGVRVSVTGGGRRAEARVLCPYLCWTQEGRGR